MEILRTRPRNSPFVREIHVKFNPGDGTVSSSGGVLWGISRQMVSFVGEFGAQKGTDRLELRGVTAITLLAFHDAPICSPIAIYRCPGGYGL
jgi:hypothetical protein